jgi:flagellar protein FlbT
MSVLKISLRAGERIFINGAVLKPDRKVTLEFLNTVTFLLEQHVLSVEETTTPLRQLYFMVQTAIIEPKSADDAISMAKQSVRLLQSTFTNPEMLANLEVVEHFITRGRHFECLRLLRKLFTLEQSIIDGRAVQGLQEPAAEPTKAMAAL